MFNWLKRLFGTKDRPSGVEPDVPWPRIVGQNPPPTYPKPPAPSPPPPVQRKPYVYVHHDGRMPYPPKELIDAWGGRSERTDLDRPSAWPPLDPIVSLVPPDPMKHSHCSDARIGNTPIEQYPPAKDD